MGARCAVCGICERGIRERRKWARIEGKVQRQRFWLRQNDDYCSMAMFSAKGGVLWIIS